jgi:hypothetical protein
MVPIGLAFVWLGYALLSGRRAKSPEAMLDQVAIKPEVSKVA